MLYNFLGCFLLIVSNCLIFGSAVPKKFDSSVGFVPSPGSFYKANEETETSSAPVEGRALITSNKINGTDGSSERIQRFGVTGYGGQYPGTAGGVGTGLYAPLKIDIGGVVLGTLIGLGAVLILPKLAYAFSGGYGGYGGGYRRSSESTLTEIMTNLESALEKYNIDSSSCMQRLVCSTVQNAKINMVSGNVSTVDQWVELLTKNNLFSNVLDGTAIKEAVDAGWGSDQNACMNYYPKCAINKQTVMQFVSNVVPT